ncbi:class I SAM-dependent methyltransferase [Xylanibacillus composti]|uniref:Methyltransferase domain-containing protein n=1 Tax=Xylanibacillus composti TaxID=1572762 RepID=A0A8J4H780_9BACL|nr:class I SAM-dependent methyltransferase [Xylanibacillus composti]GIQ71065.1 hypothetical protein XYCOK13_38890 [Xylanibacillus composti]
MTDQRYDQGIAYDGRYYEEVGDFLRENYLEYGFTHGTVQEVDYLVARLALQPGQRLLDIGCGPGRHSLELARRGIHTVGVDISSGFIAFAQQAAAGENLPAKFHTADARELAFLQEFDAAICLCEGAFGLAGSEANHRKVLQGVYAALKPGSPFVLTAIHSLHLARQLTDESEFDPYTSTVIHRETITSPEGESREAALYTTAFTYRELKLLLEGEGFVIDAGYGCTAGQFRSEPLQASSMEIMMIARKAGKPGAR